MLLGLPVMGFMAVVASVAFKLRKGRFRIYFFTLVGLHGLNGVFLTFNIDFDYSYN